MRVVVVGAGATGLGIAWDLSLRGIKVTVVEQGDIAQGTSGRFHGLLHSGARYAVRDPKAARECFEENKILRKIAVGSIEPTGGYFVEPEASNSDYSQQWVQAMNRLGITMREASLGELRLRVPELHPKIQRAYWVPDGVINGFELLFRMRQGIEMQGGTVRLFTRLSGVKVGPLGRVEGVAVQSRQGGTEWIACDGLINAAGPYASEVAKLFSHPFPMRLSRGVMLVFAERKVSSVINRLAPPGDGDILVPHHRISIWGTSDEETRSPEAGPPSIEESRRLLSLARDLFPEMHQWRVLRAFSGVRPLYQAETSSDSRHVTRDFTILDHAQMGGPEAVVSVVGGKWVTYRLMAEKAVDAMVAKLGITAACKTEDVLLPPLGESRLEPRRDRVNLCECEEVSGEEVAAWPEASLGQLRTRTWFSMGPCQGTFCLHRVAETRLADGDVKRLDSEVMSLRRERDRGMAAALWGDNARQWALSRSIRSQVLAEVESE